MAIAQVLKDEGYVENFVVIGESAKPELKSLGSTTPAVPSLSASERVSKPGLQGPPRIPQVMNGLGRCHRDDPEGRDD